MATRRMVDHHRKKAFPIPTKRKTTSKNISGMYRLTARETRMLTAKEKIMNRYICQIDGHKKTIMDAINAFCEEMFENKREVEPTSITGNAFSNNGLSFSLKDGRKTYKVVYRNSMKVFEFFKESEI